MRGFRQNTLFPSIFSGRGVLVAATCLWTMFLTLAAIWSIQNERTVILRLARAEALASYNKDLVYRRWAANNGGVYVPITDQTPPNPYLTGIPERDIFTPSGRALTLINPAYMTRQVYELSAEQYGMRGHITSLNPIRPENAPDERETRALRAFDKGEPEVTEVVVLDGERYFRLMRPMITEEGCLACHAAQGYQVGDIRGGIGVAVPLEPYDKALHTHAFSTTLWSGLIWLIGLGGIGVVYRLRRRVVDERERTDKVLRRRADEFAALYETASEIAGQTDLPELLNTITARAEKLLRVRGGEMWLYDEKRNDLQVVASTHPAVPVGGTLQMGEGMAGRVALSRQPMIVDDYSKWEHRASQYGAVPFTAVVEAPMLYRGELIGVLVAFEIDDNTRRFTEEDVRLLSLLASGVAGVIHNARDITERKRAEAELKREEVIRRSVIQRAGEGICVCHAVPEFPFVQFTVWNEQMTQLTGYNMEEINRHGWYQSMYPDPEYQQKAVARMDEMRTGKDLLSEEWTITRADGDKRTITISTSVIQGGDNIVHVLAVMADITERKRAEETLRNNEARYRAISELTSDYTFSALVENDGRVGPNWIAGAFQRITGYSWEEFIATGSWPKIVHPDDGLNDQHDLESLLKNQPIERELRIVTKTGDVRWIQNFVQPVWDNRQGRVTELVGAVRDITERKRAEEALRESEERWRTIVESEPECVKVLDSEGKVIEMNPAGLGMIQATLDDVHGQRASGLVVEEDRASFEEMIRAVFRGEPRHLVFDMIGLKGRRLTLETVSVPLWDSPEKNRVKFLVGVTRDITERKRAEMQLQEQFDELRRWHQVTIGREDRIIALKREVNELLEKAGKPPRYSSTDMECPARR